MAENTLTERSKKILFNLRTSQAFNRERLCPRCLRNMMRAPIDKYPLSREAARAHQKVYICEECARNERDLEEMNNPMPFTFWAEFKPQGGETGSSSYFQLLPRDEVLNIVTNNYIGILTHFYWLGRTDPNHKIQNEYLALESIPGLGSIRLDPFSAHFYASDGSVKVTFDCDTDGNAVAEAYLCADMLQSDKLGPYVRDW